MIMTTEPPSFVYNKINPGEIRLLTPASHDEYPAWNLEAVSLEHAYLDFDALSYTWGSQNETYPIICNGQSMRIHHNLHLALPFLARRMGELTHRPIWVDAVCIDQKNEEEKHTQIQFMNMLYRRAKQVWVWLGCAPPDVQSYIPQAIDILPHIVEEAKRRKELAVLTGKEEVALPLRNLEHNLWKAVIYLLRNSWYSRVWIVQEAALASEIAFLCGAHKIDATLLESAVESDTFASWKVSDVNNSPIKLPSTSIDNSTVFWIRDLVQTGRKSLSLDTPNLLLRMTLLMTGEHGCFMPQDRVFGMLGLVGENELANVGVDFQAYDSIPTLYTQFTTYLLLNSSPNDTQFWWPVFNLAFSFYRTEGLPSWVPDFHHQEKGSKYVCSPVTISGYGRSSKQYCSSARPTIVQLGSGPGEIIIRGKIIDEIIFVHPPGVGNIERTGKEGEDAAWLASIAEWQENVARKVLHNYEDGGNGYDDRKKGLRCVSEEVYWRTLMGNNFLDEFNKPITMETCRLFRRTMMLVGQWCNWSLETMQREAAGVEELPDEIKSRCSLQSKMSSLYHSILVKLIKLGDRQLFNTKKGRFGFTIKGVQPGDMLCVFNSASTPHVLRKVKGRNPAAYHVIGDAYVDGLMLVEADEMEIEDQDILLV